VFAMSVFRFAGTLGEAYDAKVEENRHTPTMNAVTRGLPGQEGTVEPVETGTRGRKESMPAGEKPGD